MSKTVGSGIITDSTPFRFERFTGTGLAIVRKHGSNNDNEAVAGFTHLAFTFPLKLISPRSASRDAITRIAKRLTDKQQGPIKPVAALYVVGYGGGLVSGDAVLIDMDVGEGCTLLLLTQGSTKVYKMRGKQLANHAAQAFDSSLSTSQTFRSIIRANATMVVLPDPVTCYTSARYKQIQRFDLRDAQSSSLILLDWFTPGRVHLMERNGHLANSERWAFDSYYSRNEVRIAGEVLARDVLELQNEQDENGYQTGNSIAQKCEPYTCFAMLVLYGKDVHAIVQSLKDEFHSIQQHNRSRATNAQQQEVLWSCSPITKAGEDEQAYTGGLIVRVAGLTTEAVRYWLRIRLDQAKDVIGDDLYRQAL
ncbi:UreD-domain-containing protein, partial [Meira miltonrushii]